MGDPARADGFGDQRVQAGIAIGQPATLGDAVGLVVELFRPQFMEIVEQPLLEQIRVQRGHAVHRNAAHDGQIGHAHLLFVAFLDQRHAALTVDVAGPATRDLGQEPGVDLVDDVQNARQQLAEQPHRPPLQRFGQQRVVGVGHHLAGDRPSVVPLQSVLVQQDPHQFRHPDGGMGIVELEAIFRGELAEVLAVHAHPLPDHVLQAGRSQEILLAQPQFLAAFGGVVGVEDHGDVFRHVLGAHGLGVAAGVEILEIEFVGGGCRPQPQGVDRTVLVAGNGHVVGHRQHVVGVQPAPAHLAIGFQVGFGAAAELDPLRVFGPLQFPQVAAAQPVVRFLDLITVFDALAEHAVGVADAVADHGQPQGGATVHETGRQPAQAAVAQTGVVLALGQFFQRQPHLVQRLVDRLGDAQVEHGVAQRPAHKEFHGQIVGAAHPAVGLVSVAGVLPALPQAVAQGEHQCFVHVIGVLGVPVAAQGMAEIAPKIGGDAFGVHSQGRQFGQPGRWHAFF